MNSAALIPQAEVTDPSKWNLEVERMEALWLNMSQVEMPVTHEFLPGIYRRGVRIPAGIFAIGHAHRDRCFDFVMEGCGLVVMNGVARQVEAPCVLVSEPMTRKVGIILKEFWWFTVHATTETDIEKLEAELLVKSPSFLRYEAANRKEKLEADWIDYQLALTELGTTHEAVRARTEMLEDQISLLPDEVGRVLFFNSKIEGIGMFAGQEFAAGETIVTALVGGKRTSAGRFCNHSASPNTQARCTAAGNIVFVAIQVIHLGMEITLDYRQARSAVQTL